MHIFSFFLCAIAFLLLAFSLHLVLTRQGNATLNRLLSVALLSRFWQIGVVLIALSPYQQVFPVVQKISTLFFFVAPACSYLYVRYFIKDEKRFLKRDFLHFVPLVLAAIHILPVSVGEPADWNGIADQVLEGGQLSVSEKTGLLPAGVYNAVWALLWLGYLAAMWYFIAASGILLKKWKTGKIWILFFAVMSTFFRLLTFVALLFNIMDYPYSRSPVFLIVSGMAMLFIMIFVLYQPQILYGYIIVSSPVGKEKEKSVKENVEAGKVNRNPVVKNSLDEAQQRLYSGILGEFMTVKQPFLDPDFQMKDLAKGVDIPVHHCSYVINHLIGVNFRDWLNSYRIQYFIGEYPVLADKMTVEAVARQSGFKSVATFYNAFKKETGQMPKAYFALK